MSSVLPIFTTKALWIGALLFLGILAALYVFQMSMLTQMAYMIARHETAIAQLQDTTKRLEGIIASSITFQNYDTIARDLGFEKVRSISYVELASQQVARQ
ncbi:MAG: hypothetical protein Q8P39_01370 [Candidatus Yanofskybacteria bacterium]|nr:hypothetical protein [Candidatus Yanofskybacteria bacterium]